VPEDPDVPLEPLVPLTIPNVVCANE
jgi:hypothetical protein